MDNRSFHGNKINELKMRIAMLQREEARKMSADELAKKKGYEKKHDHIEVFGEELHLFIEKDKAIYSKALAVTVDGPVIQLNNELYDKLSQEDLEALLAHELGHFHYAHNQIDTDIELEFEADEYAASIVGFDALILALENSMKVLGENKMLKHRLERLHHLKAEFEKVA